MFFLFFRSILKGDLFIYLLIYLFKLIYLLIYLSLFIYLFIYFFTSYPLEKKEKQDMTVPFARARAKLGGSIR